MRLASVLIAIICFVALARAGEVYKCTDASGDVAFQDHPCTTGSDQTLVHVDDTAPQLPAPPTSDVAPLPARPAQAALPAAPASTPLPPLWVCENAEDGTQYFSHNGVPPVRYVPLGTLGYPGQSLSQAYGPGGIGVSAPGMRKIPIDRSPDATLAGGYTPLQDRCIQASREQTCSYLRSQYDEIHEKLRRAFKDERAILQPQQDTLEAQLVNC